MGASARRIIRLLVALSFVGGTQALERWWTANAQAQSVSTARTTASSAGQAAVEAARRRLEQVQTQANLASLVPELKTLVQGGADQPTFHDALNSEAWWRPWRDGGIASGIFIERQLLAQTSAAEKARRFDFADTQQLLADVPANGRSGFLTETGWCFAAAATLPVKSMQGQSLTVVVATPVEGPVLSELTRLAGGTLVVTDGRRAVEQQGKLDAPLGREVEGSVVNAERAWAATSLGDGLWVWASAPLVPVPLPVPRGLLWGVAAGLVALAMTLLRKPPLDEKDKLLSETTHRLKQQEEQLQRISQQLSAEGRVALSPNAPVTGMLDGPAMERTTPSLQAPQPSRYQVVAPLGEGGMARVSVAVSRGAEGFRRQFVLKRLRPELTSNAEIVAQFIDEARLGASMVHSNIVPVFDFGRDAEGYFLAQEYILGRDLDAIRAASLQKRKRPIEPPLVMLIAHEALKALGYAHTRADDQGKTLNLVHRDVSPNNLMVSARGEVKLLDFGIVKSDDKRHKTQTGIIKGNVFYMSPEQARGEPVDARADLYSLGLVIFTALTFDTLYHGTTNYELLTRAGEGLSAKEWDRVRQLPAPIAAILERALQRDPAKRYGSAEEFSRAIPVSLMGTAAELQALMTQLFADDFKAEQARLTGAGR